MKRLLLSLVALSASFSTLFAQNKYEDDLYADPVRNSSNSRNNNYTTRSNQTPQKTTVYVSNGNPVSQSTESTFSGNPSSNVDNVLVTDLDQALRLRLEAMEARPVDNQEYQNVMKLYVSSLERKYDPALYNVIWINNKIWVEPKYITAVFTGDNEDATNSISSYLKGAKSPTEINVYNITTYSNPYPSYYVPRWSSWYDPWYSPYYNPWYRPYYNPWYRPYYNPWYRPYYDPWYGHWHGPSYGPGYRPGYGPSYNRRPVYYGNSRYNNSWNGNNGYNSNARPSQNARQVYNGGGGRTGGYNTGLGRGQSPATNSRPQAPTNNRQEPTYQRPESRPQTESRPQYNNDRPSSGGNGGGGFRDMGGGVRRR